MKNSLLACILFLAAIPAGAATQSKEPLPVFYAHESDNSSPQVVWKERQVVPIVSKLPVYFNASENKRDQKLTVDLPNSLGGVGSVSLDVTLSCPAGRCDTVDRVGSLGVIHQNPAGESSYFELMRFVTPYGLGEHFSLDVSDFLPLLKGRQTFRVFIDTWTGPGGSEGDGWVVDASLTYTPGTLKEETVAIIPLLSFDEVIYGDPAKSPERSRALPPQIDFTSAKVVMTVTGHGQGNLGNCAEFCPKIHRVTVNEKTFPHLIWRQNCRTTVNPAQPGNYFFPRAGWCPGDKVEPWSVDVTSVVWSENAKLSYSPEAYENSCRPDAPVCGGCSHGTTCAFDDGLHTEPRYLVSTYLIYKKGKEQR